jgi:hypothetical protein
VFSDRHRILKIVLIALAVIGLSWSVRLWEAEGPDYRQCLAEPDACDGREIPFYIDARIVRVQPDRLIITQPEGPVEIRIPAGMGGIRGKPGDYLEALAVFHKESGLELRAIQTAPLRKIKIAVSVLPVLALVFLLWRTIRWKNGRLEIKVT